MSAMNGMIALGRPIDFSYRTNRWIVILSGSTIIAAFIFQLISRVPLGQSGLFALGAGASCFLGWALTRELDPDHPLTAFPAAIASAAAVFFLGLPGFLQLFLFLFLLRGITGITGREIQIGDTLIIIGHTVWLVLLGRWHYAAAAGTGFLAAAALSKRRWLFIPGAAALLLVPVPFLIGRAALIKPELSLPAVIAILFLTLLFSLYLLFLSRISSSTDDGSHPLALRRVKVAAFFALIAASAETLISGTGGLILLLPLWTAFFFIPLLSWGASLVSSKSARIG
jgi:hypothetical protein